MSTTWTTDISTPATATTPAATTGRRTAALLGAGVLATAVASVATPLVAAAGGLAGITTEIAGEPIPILGFGTLTAVFSLVGLVMAVVMSWVARHPRRVFVRTTVVLTGLSLVPDVIVDATPGTRALLMLTHLVAAAIVIPAIARRLAV